MRIKMNWMRATAAVTVSAATMALMTFGPAKNVRQVEASDHREAPTVDGLPEGDITDLYSFVDPVDSTKVVFIMNVNPFAEAAEGGSYAFSPDMLYQFKVDNTGDAKEDQVIQIKFDQPGQGQTASVYMGVPTTTGARNTLLTSAPVATAKFGVIPTVGSGVTAYVGLRDDPFVFDFAQLGRILNGSQDLFRAIPSAGFRGRPVRADGTSGVDTFAGFNVTSIAVSVPKASLRGSGPQINIWATVSSLVPTRHGQNTYTQFERMGQQAIATVFVPAAMRDAFNFAIPENDVATYSGLLPDALTPTDNDGSGNTIAGRVALLNQEGLTTLPNGAPLLLPATFSSSFGKDLFRIAILPDVQRLNVDEPANQLDIGVAGLQNGRPLDYSTIDIPFQLLRQLADVKFPSGASIPGGGPLGTRAALTCTGFPQCEDRRVLAVLQGTQFIKPDSTITQYLDGNDYPFLSTFPYAPNPHPVPGAAGTIDYPTQQ